MKHLGCDRHSDPKKLSALLEKNGTIHHAIGAVHGEEITFAPNSDLTIHAPPGPEGRFHFHQGKTGSCGGHAIAMWIAICAAIRGYVFDFAGPPSPRGLYGGARSETQAPPAPLTDSGVQPADPINAAQTIGVRGMAVKLTPDGRYSDIWGPLDVEGLSPPVPANDSLRPTAAEDVVSSKDLVVGAYVIDPRSPNFTKLVAAALSAEKPVAATIFVDTPFEIWGDASPTPNAPPLDGTPNFSDPDGGGHYVVILAHKTLATGKLAFLIWNSWGGEWGVPSAQMTEAGNIWVTEEWLAASCSEAYGGDLTISSPKAAA